MINTDGLHTLEDWIGAVDALRDAADAAEEDYMRMLEALEATRLWVTWTSTFDLFLGKIMHNSRRYRDWQKARETIPEEVVSEIGHAACVRTGSIRDSDRRHRVLEEVVKTTRNRGYPMTSKEVGVVDARLYPKDEEKEPRLSRLQRLQSELRETKKKLRAAEATIRRRDKRIQELEALLRSGAASSSAVAAE